MCSLHRPKDSIHFKFTSDPSMDQSNLHRCSTNVALLPPIDGDEILQIIDDKMLPPTASTTPDLFDSANASSSPTAAAAPTTASRTLAAATANSNPEQTPAPPPPPPPTTTANISSSSSGGGGGEYLLQMPRDYSMAAPVLGNVHWRPDPAGGRQLFTIPAAAAAIPATIPTTPTSFMLPPTAASIAVPETALTEFDTHRIALTVRELLSAHNIGQRVFARHVLGLSQGTVSELLSKPKPWTKLTEKGRESYRKMWSWANYPEGIAVLKTLSPRRGTAPAPHPGGYSNSAAAAAAADTARFAEAWSRSVAPRRVDEQKPPAAAAAIRSEGDNGPEVEQKVVQILCDAQRQMQMLGMRSADENPRAAAAAAAAAASTSRRPSCAAAASSSLIDMKPAAIIIAADGGQVSLDTEKLVKQVKQFLSQHCISQRAFGEMVLGLSQGSVSDLLARPKAWTALTQKGREPFLRMDAFLRNPFGYERLFNKQANGSTSRGGPFSNSNNRPPPPPPAVAVPPPVTTGAAAAAAAAAAAPPPPPRQPPSSSSSSSNISTFVFPASTASRPAAAAADELFTSRAAAAPGDDAAAAAAATAAASSANEIDTETISQRVKEVLATYQIGQRLFGESVLNLSQGTVSELLSKPKPWRLLSAKGREPYQRMWHWINDPDSVKRLVQFKLERSGSQPTAMQQSVLQATFPVERARTEGRPVEFWNNQPHHHHQHHHHHHHHQNHQHGSQSSAVSAAAHLLTSSSTPGASTEQQIPLQTAASQLYDILQSHHNSTYGNNPPTASVSSQTASSAALLAGTQAILARNPVAQALFYSITDALTDISSSATQMLQQQQPPQLPMPQMLPEPPSPFIPQSAQMPLFPQQQQQQWQPQPAQQQQQPLTLSQPSTSSAKRKRYTPQRREVPYGMDDYKPDASLSENADRYSIDQPATADKKSRYSHVVADNNGFSQNVPNITNNGTGSGGNGAETSANSSSSITSPQQTNASATDLSSADNGFFELNKPSTSSKNSVMETPWTD